jgi:hypothetical protein
MPVTLATSLTDMPESSISRCVMTESEHAAHATGANCGICQSDEAHTAPSSPRLATLRFTARGEDFRIVQLQGQLLVCARQHGSCCCGWDEKGWSTGPTA